MSNPLALVIKQGSALAVLRPEDPQKALARADEVKDDHDAFQRMISEQKYTFLGLLQRDTKIIDPKTRKPVGTIQPGDSFVSWKQFRKGLENGAVEVLNEGQAR